MELNDDSTYAVIVSESGEAQTFKLGCIDSFRDSNGLATLVNRHMAGVPADVISEESNHKIEDHRSETEVRSPHGCRKRRKPIAQEPDPDDIEIVQNNYELRHFHSARKFSKRKYRNENQKIILPTNAGDITEADNNDKEARGRGWFFWTRAMTRALIDEYRALTVDFQNPQKRQRDVWESLAKELRRKGCPDVTGDMCDRKWRNLKSTFKTIYYSDRELYSKRKWEYYDEFEILFAPDVRGTRMERKSRTIPAFSRSIQQDETVLLEDIRDDIESGENSRGMLSKPGWFRRSLNSYRTGYETELRLARQQHNKRMNTKNLTCQLLERLIDTI